MNYTVFEENVLNSDPLYGTQTHMERTIRTATDSDAGIDTYNNLLSPRFVSCSAEAQTLTLGFSCKPWMLNPHGIIHGGIIASAFDLTMGMLTRYCGQLGSCSTLHLDVQYMRPVLYEGEMLVTAKAEKIGKRVCFMSAVMRPDPEGDPLAMATAQFM